MALAQEEKKYRAPKQAPAEPPVIWPLGKVPSLGCFFLGTRVHGQALGQDWNIPVAEGRFP